MSDDLFFLATSAEADLSGVREVVCGVVPDEALRLSSQYPTWPLVLRRVRGHVVGSHTSLWAPPGGVLVEPASIVVVENDLPLDLLFGARSDDLHIAVEAVGRVDASRGRALSARADELSDLLSESHRLAGPAGRPSALWLASEAHLRRRAGGRLSAVDEATARASARGWDYPIRGLLASLVVYGLLDARRRQASDRLLNLLLGVGV